LEDVFGDMKDVTDMAGVEGTTGAETGAETGTETGAETGAETTENGVRNEGEEGESAVALAKADISAQREFGFAPSSLFPFFRPKWLKG
jgi:hypothetical protein